MKYVFSYTSPGKINRLYIIVNMDKIDFTKLPKIKGYQFSRYESRLCDFHPSTNGEADPWADIFI